MNWGCQNWKSVDTADVRTASGLNVEEASAITDINYSQVRVISLVLV